MDATRKNVPAARATAKVLQLFRCNDEVACSQEQKEAACRVLSYKRDFDYLWSVGGHADSGFAEHGQGSARTLLLVYDGLPEGKGTADLINVEGRVTPYDWVVHFFLKTEEQAPRLRLFILDVASSENETAFAARTIPALLPLLPWVRIYRLFKPTDLQASFNHQRLGFLQLVTDQAGAQVPFLDDVDPTVTETARALAKETWINNLIRPEGRHEVSNLVAPFVLAEGLRSLQRPTQDLEAVISQVTGKSTLRAALAELLRTLGIFRRRHWEAEVISGPLEVPFVQNDIFGQFEQVRFLLVDDQVELGYDEIIAYLLFAEVRRDVNGKVEEIPRRKDGCALTSITSPAPLVEALFQATGIDEAGSADAVQPVRWEQPRLLNAYVIKGEMQKLDILLLDLRLFGDAKAMGETEKQYLERLLRFYERSGAEAIADEHLHRAARAAHHRLSRSQEGQQASEEGGLMHLALLPLLLSHVDPSLPIVLFSSTRQRLLLEALTHRPNLITTFSKPVVSGYAEERSPGDYMVNLNGALRAALKLHEARCIWKRLIGARWKHNPIFETAGKGGRIAVYNAQRDEALAAHPSGRSRYHAGTARPRSRGPALRTIFADLYSRYVQQPRHFDFASVPWEFLEGDLVPRRILTSPWVANPLFGLPEDLDPRNHLAQILERLRNKKTHGQAQAPQGRVGEEQHRTSAILTFLVLLDLIEGAVSSELIRSGEVKEVGAYLRMRYSHLRRSESVLKVKLKPYRLGADPEIAWLDFVLFTAVYEANRAREGNQSLLSDQTITAIRQLLQVQQRRLWKENGSSLPEVHTRLSGRALASRARGGFYMEVKSEGETFFGALAEIIKYPGLKPGAEIPVVMDDVEDGCAELKEKVADRLWIGLGKRLPATDEYEAKRKIQTWFTPPPARVIVKQSMGGQWYAFAQFGAPKEAFEALQARTWPDDAYVKWAS